MSQDIKRRQEPDQIDRLRDHIVNDVPLTDPDDLIRIDQIKLIWPICIEENGALAPIVKKIVSLQICGPKYAYKLVRLTEDVYGRVHRANKEGRRAILVETLTKAMLAAEKKEAYNAVERIAAQIAKLEGLYQTEDNLGDIIDGFELPAPVLSDDPGVLDGDFDVDVEG